MIEDDSKDSVFCINSVLVPGCIQWEGVRTAAAMMQSGKSICVVEKMMTFLEFLTRLGELKFIIV